MERKFYIQDTRSYVGNCILFWMKGGGYTTHVRDAELFTSEEAKKIHERRKTDLPIPEDTICEAMTYQVDIQLLRHIKAQ